MQFISSKNLQVYFLLIWLMVFVVNTKAQDRDSTRHITEDGWIEVMDHKVAMDVSVNNSFEIFEVKTTSNTFILYPNTPNHLQLRMSYKFISFAFQFAPDFLPGNGDEYLRGKTDTFKLGISLSLKKWFFQISYAKVKGYYLYNTDDFNAPADGEPFIQFPDLSYRGFSLNSGFINNPKFSTKSLTSQTERQLKSAGSFIPAIYLRYYIIDDKSSDVNTQKSNNIEANLGPGYVYNFVVKEKFYFSLALIASLGYLNTKLTTRLPEGDDITHQDNLIFRGDGKIGVGYNGPQFYMGLYANSTLSEYRQENTTVMNFDTRVFYHLFIGYRIKAPSFVRKQMKVIESKIPK